MSIDTYEFDKNFQFKCASLILRDPTFLRDYEDVVQPNYFDFTSISSVIRVGIECYQKHNQIPTKATLTKKIQDFCSRFGIVDEREEILDVVDTIYKEDLSDSNIVAQEIIEFGKHQALKQGVLQIADLIEAKKNYQQSKEIIEKALQIGQNTTNLGIHFYKDLNTIEERIRQETTNVKKVRTFMPSLNKYTLGGPGRGELWVVMALPGFGKSQYLLNIANSALDQGIPVVYITIGDLTENDIYFRLLARRTLTNMEDLLGLNPKFLKRVDKIKKYVDKYFRIKFYPSYTITPQNIRSYITRLVTVDGIKPGQIIVDYPEECKPYCDDLYTNSGRQYSELGAIASDFDANMWVASQISRSDLKNKGNPYTDENFHIAMTNVSDSWKKPQLADGICSLNQTREEYIMGDARLWLDKTRRGEKFKRVLLETDYKMSYIQEAPQQTRDSDDDY